MPTKELKNTIADLKKLGSAQTKKIYLRHGATEPLFGVKFGDLTKLKKKLGTDHELAAELWETGNSDAMTLALMIADPKKMKSGDIDRWLTPLKYGFARRDVERCSLPKPDLLPRNGRSGQTQRPNRNSLPPTTCYRIG